MSTRSKTCSIECLSIIALYRIEGLFCPPETDNLAAIVELPLGSRAIATTDVARFGVVEQGVTMNSEEFAGGVHAVPAVHVYLWLS